MKLILVSDESQYLSLINEQVWLSGSRMLDDVLYIEYEALVLQPVLVVRSETINHITLLAHSCYHSSINQDSPINS